MKNENKLGIILCCLYGAEKDKSWFICMDLQLYIKT